MVPNYFVINLANGTNPELVTLEDVMVFFSGAEKPPPLGFPKKPTLDFSSTNMYPTSSTCTLMFMLPTKYGTDYEAFKKAMTIGLKCHGGFGNM